MKHFVKLIYANKNKSRILDSSKRFSYNLQQLTTSTQHTLFRFKAPERRQIIFEIAVNDL